MPRFATGPGLAAALMLGVVSVANAAPATTGIAALDAVLLAQYEAAIAACSSTTDTAGTIVAADVETCRAALAFYVSLASPAVLRALPEVVALGLPAEQLDAALTSAQFILSFSTSLADAGDTIVANNPSGSAFLVAFASIAQETLGFNPGAGPDLGAPLPPPLTPS